MSGGNDITAPATPEAQQWSGWGTALKPAWEPIIVARKPLCGTVAENVLKHGTGGINVDGCRVDGGVRPLIESTASLPPKNALGGSLNGSRCAGTTTSGRWPANVIHDGIMHEHGRYFYCAKASKADRDDGCENNHPTVKPTELMRYLVRLVTPPGGVVLDPFCGSGSTGRGAILEQAAFIGIELDADYLEIARRRINACLTPMEVLL